MTKKIQSLLLIFTCLIAGAAYAQNLQHNGALIQTEMLATDKLGVDIRNTESNHIENLSAFAGDIQLPVNRSSQRNDNRSNVILFLVDTSDPRRTLAVDQAVGHIQQILQSGEPAWRYGLASFDSDLRMLSPMGSSAAEIIKHLGGLQAVGKTTELYRNTLVAIRKLSAYPAERRFLFLMSDGLAEDYAYFHRDVVQAASQNGVSIFSIGYANSVSNTVALQTLRRLSEDTSGQYIATQPGSYALSDTELAQLTDNIDTGSYFQVDLKPMVDNGVGGKTRITLNAAGLGRVDIPVELPKIALRPKSQAEVTVATPRPAPQIIVQREVITQPAPVVSDISYWGWIIAAIVSLLALTGLGLYLNQRRRVAKQKAKEEAEALAWLEILDNRKDPQRYAIRSLQTKIGRYRDNDLTLPDSAVSRYHAEISITENGDYIVRDLGSKNGMMINDVEVKSRALRDGDIIEIGDIQIRFILPDETAQDMQVTQAFRTEYPLIL